MRESEWFGLALMIVYLGYGYFKVRAERRSGKTQSFGHPVLDAFLLFVAALLLTTAMVLIFFYFGSHFQGARWFVYILLLLLGGGLTWFSNRVLRRR
jgi:ABC-type xylose transport system permease subunit